MDQKVSLPARGERVAKYVEDYLAAHPGLSQGELCIRLRVIDKRDMQRLIRDRSVGHRMEDALAAYFGQHFIDALFPQELFGGRSIRERELQNELAQIEARNQKLERERAARRAAASGHGLRLDADQDRSAAVSIRRED